jgi:hypothetical protein
MNSDFVPIEVWRIIIIMSNLDYQSIRFATVSKAFYQIVFHSITDLTTLLDDCEIMRGKDSSLKVEDINDVFIQQSQSIISKFLFSMSSYY